MKKIALYFMFTSCLMLFGCNNPQTVNQDETTIAENEKTVDTTENEQQQPENDNLNSTDNVPEWVAPYAQLEQYPETIYLDGEEASFSIENDKLAFPETNLIIVSKKIAGDKMAAITDDKENIIEMLDCLKEENILTEAESVNPEGKIINLDFDLVFLTVEGKYALMEFSLFEDNRILVDITSEDSDLPISLWVKSDLLSEKIKAICKFEKYELSLCKNFESIEIYNSQNQMYKLTDEELSRFKDILSNLDEETSLCSGPYDIVIKGISSDEEISMEWCNDGCGILAVKGYCYKVDENDKEWIQELISMVP